MSGIRQAALCIHGLSPKDKKWILKRLPRTQRLAIKAMLSELKQLGIPPNQDWLPKIEEKKDNEQVESKLNNTTKNLVELIDGASVAEIKRVLLSESDEFIATIMSIRYWSWSDQFMKIFSNKRKNQIEGLIEERKQPLKPMVMATLIAIVADEIGVGQDK